MCYNIFHAQFIEYLGLLSVFYRFLCQIMKINGYNPTLGHGKDVILHT